MHSERVPSDRLAPDTGQPSQRVQPLPLGASGCGLTRRVGEYQTGLEISCRTRCQMIMLDAPGTSLVPPPSRVVWVRFPQLWRTAARPFETGAASRFVRPAAGLAPCSPKRSSSRNSPLGRCPEIRRKLLILREILGHPMKGSQRLLHELAAVCTVKRLSSLKDRSSGQSIAGCFLANAGHDVMVAPDDER